MKKVLTFICKSAAALAVCFTANAALVIKNYLDCKEDKREFFYYC